MFNNISIEEANEIKAILKKQHGFVEHADDKEGIVEPFREDPDHTLIRGWHCKNAKFKTWYDKEKKAIMMQLSVVINSYNNGVDASSGDRIHPRYNHDYNYVGILELHEK
jgi:hypothetical protein